MDEQSLSAISERWWDEVWGQADLDAVDEILTDPFVRHTSLGTSVSSRSQYKSMLADFQRTLCRPVTVIDDRVFGEDTVWTRATSRGLNRETGEIAVVTWMLVQRMADGRIAEHWVLTARGVDWTA